jgi:hypothetical protein
VLSETTIKVGEREKAQSRMQAIERQGSGANVQSKRRHDTTEAAAMQKCSRQ